MGQKIRLIGAFPFGVLVSALYSFSVFLVLLRMKGVQEQRRKSEADQGCEGVA